MTERVCSFSCLSLNQILVKMFELSIYDCSCILDLYSKSEEISDFHMYVHLDTHRLNTHSNVCLKLGSSDYWKDNSFSLFAHSICLKISCRCSIFHCFGRITNWTVNGGCLLDRVLLQKLPATQICFSLDVLKYLKSNRGDFLTCQFDLDLKLFCSALIHLPNQLLIFLSFQMCFLAVILQLILWSFISENAFCIL